MTNLETLALGLLSTEHLFLGKKVYERITFEEMRENVLSRARETLAALEGYTGGALDAPMAWTARNAIAIKIGYGAKNEALWTFANAIGDATDTLRANGQTREKQRTAAIAFFHKAIPAIEGGALDDKIRAKHASYAKRGEQGKIARKSKSEKRKAVSNVVALAA